MVIYVASRLNEFEIVARVEGGPHESLSNVKNALLCLIIESSRIN